MARGVFSESLVGWFSGGVNLAEFPGGRFLGGPGFKFSLFGGSSGQFSGRSYFSAITFFNLAPHMGCLFTEFSWGGFFGGLGFTFTSFSSAGGRFLGGLFSGFSLFWGSG